MDATESPPGDVDDYCRQLEFTVHQPLQLLRGVYGCYAQGYNVCRTMDTFLRARLYELTSVYFSMSLMTRRAKFKEVKTITQKMYNS